MQTGKRAAGANRLSIPEAWCRYPADVDRANVLINVTGIPVLRNAALVL